MSGVVGLLIGIGLRIGRRVSGTVKRWSDVPDWLFIIIGAVCLFWAGYAAWKDKNDALITLQQHLKSPELGGTLGMLSSGSMDKQPLVSVGGVITNPLGPPTALLGWGMSIEFADRIIDGIVPLTHQEDTKFPVPSGRQNLVLSAKDYWPEKSQQPIPAGGVLEGWIWAVFPGLDIDELYEKNARVIVTYKDAATMKEHSLDIHAGRRGFILPGYTPEKH